MKPAETYIQSHAGSHGMRENQAKGLCDESFYKQVSEMLQKEKEGNEPLQTNTYSTSAQLYHEMATIPKFILAKTSMSLN